MNLVHEFGHVSGLELRAFTCVGHRWDGDWEFGVDNGESFVVDVEGDRVTVGTQLPAHFTGLWRSEAAVVHVSHLAGQIGTRRPETREKWEVNQLGQVLYGVWGLDDDHVYAWGDTGGKPTMFRFDGRSWQEMASPARHVNAMHGVSPNSLFAVGSQGLIAHFDGRKWRQLPSPLSMALSSVFVVDENEAYACSPGARSVLEGSVHGWVIRARHVLPVQGVAKYDGTVYVGAGNDGLHRLDGATLQQVTTDFQAVKLDARGELLISARDKVASTTDGRNFDWRTLDQFADAVAGREPSWSYE